LGTGREFREVKSVKKFLNFIPIENGSCCLETKQHIGCQEESCLFQIGDYRNKAHSPEKSVLGLHLSEDIALKDIFCHSAIHIEWSGLTVSGNKD
jgi:hypothetical protein